MYSVFARCTQPGHNRGVLFRLDVFKAGAIGCLINSSIGLNKPGTEFFRYFKNIIRKFLS
jgi:hypothetical protein